jgi:DUF4097 and DUF4098 domain-containing protein YvlB
MLKIQVKLTSGEIRIITGKTWKVMRILHQLKHQIDFFDVLKTA